MPTSAQVSVGVTPTLLVASTGFDQTVWLHNGGGVAIYIGDSTVTSSNGFRLDNGDKMQLPVGDHESLYAVSAANSNIIYILKQIN